MPEFVQDSFEEYLGNKDYLSSSALKQIMRTPKHYQSYLEREESEEKDHLVMGSALHCLILEPDCFYERNFVWLESMKPEPNADYRNSKNKQARDNAKAIAKLKGQALLEESQMNNLLKMSASIKSNSMAMKLLEGTQREMSLYTELDIDGMPIKVKVRPDAVCDKYYVSLKTTSDASPTGFGRKAYNLGYQISEAFYSTITGLPGYIIAVENEEPFITQVFYTHDQDLGTPLPWIMSGLHTMNLGFLRLKEYFETGVLKGYDIYSEREDGLLEMKLPRYAEYETNNSFI